MKCKIIDLSSSMPRKGVEGSCIIIYRIRESSQLVMLRNHIKTIIFKVFLHKICNVMCLIFFVSFVDL